MELLINLFLLDITSRIFIELINQCSICNVINIICIPENQPRKSQAVERVSYFEAGNSTLLIVTSTESLHWHWSPLLLLPFIVCSIKSLSPTSSHTGSKPLTLCACLLCNCVVEVERANGVLPSDVIAPQQESSRLTTGACLPPTQRH